VLDISDRQAVSKNLLIADEALRTSIERFELIAKATNDAIWDWDIEANLLTGNDGLNKTKCFTKNTGR
jgi:PAS domain-containing protein